MRLKSTPPKKRHLLSFGNSKLGEMHTFSLPAVHTCPGRSSSCESACYARKGTVRFAQRSYVSRWKASKQARFVPDMVEEIRSRGVSLVRLHVSGDFYSAKYAAKWLAIVQACPETRFFVYTRSWRVAEIRPTLRRLARERNIRVWFSCDSETGLPSSIPRRVRIAYMAVTDEDHPNGTPDLVFRVKRKTVKKFSEGRLVCPSENGVTKTTCKKCAVCWSPLEVRDPRRIALATC